MQCVSVCETASRVQSLVQLDRLPLVVLGHHARVGALVLDGDVDDDAELLRPIEDERRVPEELPGGADLSCGAR